MWAISVVGIGMGDPRQLTGEALDAMAAADAFVVTAKVGRADELESLRLALIAQVGRADATIVRVTDPERDRAPADYAAAVGTWHDARAVAWRAAIADALPDGGRVAVLTWGDPAFYDSTIRVAERIGDATVTVVPGVSALNLLAARHRLVLNGVGGAVHVTTGRHLLDAWQAGHADIVVMLDGSCAFQHLRAPATIYWGAYLGMDGELLMTGELPDVAPAIIAARDAARTTRGWIMDTYLIRRSSTG